MSLRHLLASVAVVAALLTSVGCCGHRHHRCCGSSCNSCYSSPASRTEAPSFLPVPGHVQPQ